MTCSRLTLLVLCTIFLRTCAISDNSSKLEPKSAALYDPSDEVALRGYAGFEALYFYRNQVQSISVIGPPGYRAKPVIGPVLVWYGSS